MSIYELQQNQSPIAIEHPEHGLIYMHIESINEAFGTLLLEGLTNAMLPVAEHVSIAWFENLLKGYELGEIG